MAGEKFARVFVLLSAWLSCVVTSRRPKQQWLGCVLFLVLFYGRNVGQLGKPTVVSFETVFCCWRRAPRLRSKSEIDFSTFVGDAMKRPRMRDTECHVTWDLLSVYRSRVTLGKKILVKKGYVSRSLINSHKRVSAV